MSNSLQSQEIITGVYNTLKEGTQAISGAKAELSILDEKIASGRYSDSVVKDFKEKRAELSKSIRMEAEGTIKQVNESIAQYMAEETARRNMLKPSEITDDIRLLQAGVTLNRNDLESILDRTEGNRTMFHIVTRYAKEHGIEISGKYRVDNGEDEKLANALSLIVNRYGAWINTGKAREMLNKLYGAAFPHFFDDEDEDSE